MSLERGVPFYLPALFENPLYRDFNQVSLCQPVYASAPETLANTESKDVEGCEERESPCDKQRATVKQSSKWRLTKIPRQAVKLDRGKLQYLGSGSRVYIGRSRSHL